MSVHARGMARETERKRGEGVDGREGEEEREREREREREMCLHQTDVIEHVIYLNGIVRRNRNSVTCGSSSIMVMSGDGSNGIRILYMCMPQW